MTQSAQKLQEFRSKAYQLLGRAKDATNDLMDAVLVTRNIYSFAELSLSPVFRRKWPSLYEALDDCRPNRHKKHETLSERNTNQSKTHHRSSISHCAPQNVVKTEYKKD